MIKRVLTVALLIIPVPLAILGAKTGIVGYLYALSLAAIGIVILIGCSKIIPCKLYPLAIFTISLSLLYQTTLISPYLVGTDIHSEYFYYLSALDGWDLSLTGNYNTAVGITVLAPFLTNYLHIDGLTIFKAVYPFLFAFAPMFLYLAYKNFIDEKLAFLAAFFFVSVPMFMLEVIGITKLQLSGLGIALLLFLIFYKGWPGKVRLGLVVVVTILVVMFHYSTGYVLLYFIGAGAVIYLILKLLKLGKPGLSVWVPIFVAVVLAGSIFAYFSSIGSSLSNPMNWVEPSRYAPPLEAQVITEQEPMIKTALGLDFIGASAGGKAFRIIQFITEAFIVIGFVFVLVRSWKRKGLPTEFLALATAGLLLLAACIWLPQFSRLLNISRFYHITLYSIAPLAVIGGAYALKRARQWAIPAITLVLVVYFAFTSGLTYEMSGQPDISKFEMPYSMALAHNRIDMVAVATEQDQMVLEWVRSNRGDHMIYTDIHGKFLLLEQIELDTDAGYLPIDLSLVPHGAWIFLREWNQENKMLTYHAGIGLRKSLSYEYLGVPDLLKDRPLLCSFGYDDHQASIYGAKEE